MVSFQDARDEWMEVDEEKEERSTSPQIMNMCDINPP